MKIKELIEGGGSWGVQPPLPHKQAEPNSYYACLYPHFENRTFDNHTYMSKSLSKSIQEVCKWISSSQGVSELHRITYQTDNGNSESLNPWTAYFIRKTDSEGNFIGEIINVTDTCLTK